MRTRFLLVLLVVTLFNTIKAQTIYGKVIGRKGEPIPFANVVAEDTLNHIMQGLAQTDVYGFYKISPINSGYYFILSYDVSYPIKKSMIKITGDTIININMAVPCEYDKSIDNNFCTICRSNRDVIPIVYGLLITTNGMDTTFYAGGCIVSYCHPHWYCKRDKIKF
jgi:hypothetical protein